MNLCFLAGLKALIQPEKAHRKPRVDCKIGPFAPIPPGPALVANAGVAGGFFFAHSFEVPANVALALTSDLAVVCNEDIDIAGQIRPGARLPGLPSVNILLISLEGDIRLWQGGVVGGGAAAAGRDATCNGPFPIAVGAPGSHGGWIKMVAARGSIHVDGTILGNAGGDGGHAIADSTLATTPALSPWLWLPLVGAAFAVGGEPGDGGDVYLCAHEGIHLGAPAPPAGARIYGGAAGVGGAGEALSENAIAFARSGPRGTGPGKGGSVRLDLAGAGPPVQVFIDGWTALYGGDGHPPANARATATSQGAPARAIGGQGGPGGEVIFRSTVVWNNGTIQSGGGGQGGGAVAEGGAGAAGRGDHNGRPGGRAKADGGLGAWPGPPPVYLDGSGTPWRRAFGSVGKSPAGGSAEAKGGPGGPAGPKGLLGGPSGEGIALGGAGSVTGKAPALPATSAPNPPATTTGAAGSPANQAGTR